MSGSEMNEMMLLPHQQRFVDQVLGATDIARFYLEAPPGMGKSLAFERLAVEAVRRSPRTRVLYIAPTRNLIDHFAQHAAPSVRVRKIDRFAFRERAELGGSTKVFGSPGIYALTLQFAQIPDVRAALLSTGWDLLVCDGIGELPDASVTAGVLDDLASASARTVIAGSPPGNADVSNASVVRWDKAAAVDAGGHRVGPPQPVLVDVPYPVSVKYDRLLQQALADQDLLAGAEGTLVQALRSSPAAAEMVALEHEAGLEDEKSQGSARLAAAILREIDTLHADEKLSALLAYLADLDPQRRVCVATRFVQTAYYLSSALSEIAPVELFLAGHEPFGSGPDQTARILVGGLQSLSLRTDLASADDLVFYDGESSPAALRLIETANALGRSKPLTVATLRPMPEGSSSEKPAAIPQS